MRSFLGICYIFISIISVHSTFFKEKYWTSETYITSSRNEQLLAFKGYLDHFGKDYPSSEIDNRLDIFLTNLAEINKHNALEEQEKGQNPIGITHRKGINQFTDMNEKEFKEKILCEGIGETPIDPSKLRTFNNDASKQQDMSAQDISAQNYIPLDYSLDSFVVTSVKDQAQCGGCWAFSCAGALEGMYGIAGKPFTPAKSFSSQMLISCDTGNDGCDGGNPILAFLWIGLNGICTDEDYPFTATDGITPSCITGCSADYTLADYAWIGGGESAIAEALLNNGPISIAVASWSWNSYSSGVLSTSSCIGGDLDHGVLLVGIVQKDGQQAWKVKNSWGTGWGEDGYIYLPMGVDCAQMTSLATYPLATGSASILHGGQISYFVMVVGALLWMMWLV